MDLSPGGRMTKLVTICLALLFFVLLLIVLAPVNNAQIYSIAVKRLIMVDDSYGGRLNPQKVYLSESTLDFREVLTGKLEGNDKISKPARREIKKSLAALGVEVTWVTSPESLTYTEQGEIVGGGVLVYCGRIKESYFSPSVICSIGKAAMAASGTRYVFYRWFTEWKLWNSSLAWIS